MNVFNRLIIVTVSIVTIFLSSCSADIDNYQTSKPSFDLFGYFEGNVKAWGMVQDYTDQQTRRFEPGFPLKGIGHFNIVGIKTDAISLGTNGKFFFCFPACLAKIGLRPKSFNESFSA